MELTDENGTTARATVTEPAGGSAYKIRGLLDDPDGTAVIGRNDATSGSPTGVLGRVQSGDAGATGVEGIAGATAGRTWGVAGYTSSGDDGAAGVRGSASATATAETFGVYGKTLADADASTGTHPAGVRGNAYGTGRVRGVEGVTGSTEGRGVYGRATAGNGVTVGVKGTADSDANGTSGVYGRTTASQGETVGVYGVSDSSDGYGVIGQTTASDGENYGVYGYAQSSGGYAVYAKGDAEVTGTATLNERSVTNTGVSVYQATSQNVSSGSDGEPLSFDRYAYDDRGNYDIALDEYTAPVDGRYRVVATTMLKSGGAWAAVAIKINGTRKGFGQQDPGGVGEKAYPNPSVEKTFDLATGDKIQPYVYNYSGSSLDTRAGEAFTYMTVEQVS